MTRRVMLNHMPKDVQLQVGRSLSLRQLVSFAVAQPCTKGNIMREGFHKRFSSLTSKTTTGGPAQLHMPMHETLFAK